MKRILLLLAAVSLTLAASAQHNAQARRHAGHQQRAAQMARQLMLGQDDAAWFEQHYTAYLDTLAGIAARYRVKPAGSAPQPAVCPQKPAGKAAGKAECPNKADCPNGATCKKNPASCPMAQAACTQAGAPCRNQCDSTCKGDKNACKGQCGTCKDGKNACKGQCGACKDGKNACKGQCGNACSAQHGKKATKGDKRKPRAKASDRTLTDAEATAIVENQFARSESELVIKRQYYKLFKRRLTPQQLVKVFRQNEGNGKQAGRSGDDRFPGGPRGGFPFGGPHGGPHGPF